MSLAHDLAASLLRRIDPETAHEFALAALAAGLGPRDVAGDDPILATSVCGLSLANPVGLAAGFDKDARAPAALLTAGFGYVECGTVTPRPQAGNPRPRLFRLAEDQAVINRMGFNNRGFEAFAGRMSRLGRRRGPVGANIGANKDAADRVADYLAGLDRFWDVADYFTLNVSSPNTAGLRDLQHRSALGELLAAVGQARLRLVARTARDRPIFLKIAPDLDEPEVVAIVEAAEAHRLDGLIVSNTTVERPPTLIAPARGEAGGLSGAPLFDLSTRVLRTARRAAGDRLTLIGVGGVASGADAYAKIRAGASAVQLYTAVALQGPGLVSRIKAGLATRLRADGFSSVRDAVGAS